MKIKSADINKKIMSKYFSLKRVFIAPPRFILSNVFLRAGVIYIRL